MSETTSKSIREDLTQRDELSLYTRIANNPRPFFKWAVPMLVLIAVEFPTYAGVAFGMLDAVVIGVTGLLDAAIGLVSSGLSQTIRDAQYAVVGVLRDAGGFVDGLPTLFSREVIPNQGYQTGPNGPWEGTFLGLEPAYAWALRATLIFAYALFTAYWVFRGWLVYRDHYREADWTPTDDIVDNLSNHQWGKFGIFVLILFLTMAVFGSALGPTTVEQNIQSPYSERINYFNEDTGEVDQVFPGDANFNSKSKGSAEFNVGPMSYDDYGRFHPFGTLTNGRDLFTFMMGGARITMIVSALAIGGAALIAAVFSMFSAYYSGRVDLTILTTADGVVSIPRLLLLILVSAVFANHWIGNVLNGGFLLAIIFAFTTWPFLWRAVRGPALQVAQEEWILAAKSYGQQPRTIMRKHMFPYIVGYLLVYASMSTGGIIIGLAALSFLGNGLGISPPTPAWGRAISMGQDYVSGPSWHISLLPGLMIVLLVTGLNALGDGIRDAIDPEAGGSAEGEEAAAGGGG
ncbi:ABC transporter permease [Halapricum hydrolyticum]|uniref:ABC transporter permease n=1 Tax=Halapricum hydrolyticum TaxID=2979991 RepID=A0AAE3IC90_9EURY|nr:ABC transporter permease [Halapricum hydrolyticum]MCU4716660.1 ABC transporter permease [Halapricum hydrolyticum]MCU4725735.1 ABC transporter permease [Halapricum hydrolyticum]